MSPRGLDPDYVDVAERISEFYTKYPTGSLQAVVDGVPMQVGDQWYVKYVAAAYRTPDDPRPGIGTAWEPVPGPTNFTRLSELQNAETSAWGRAIVACGIPSKKIATAQDVRNRQDASPAAPGMSGSGHPPAGSTPAPAAGEAPSIQGELDKLVKAIGTDNAKIAYDLALHNAGLAPGEVPTAAQQRKVIDALVAAGGIPA